MLIKTPVVAGQIRVFGCNMDPIFGSSDSKVAKAPGDLPAMEQKGRVAEPIQRSSRVFSPGMRMITVR